MIDTCGLCARSSCLLRCHVASTRAQCVCVCARACVRAHVHLVPCRYDTIPAGVVGELWLEITPQSFNIRLRTGLALTQMMVFRREPAAAPRDSPPTDARKVSARKLPNAATSECSNFRMQKLPKAETSESMQKPPNAETSESMQKASADACLCRRTGSHARTATPAGHAGGWQGELRAYELSDLWGQSWLRVGLHWRA